VSDYTLALTDDDFLPTGAAGAIVVTVPADGAVAFPVGVQKTIQRTGSGAVSIAASGGVTVTRPGGTDATARGTGSVITLVKTGADAWALAGDLTPTAASAAAGAVTTSGLTMATARLLGRTTADTGAVEEISVGSGLTLSAGELIATATGAASVTNVTRTTTFAHNSSGNWLAIPWSGTERADVAAWSAGNATRLTVPSGFTKARFSAYVVWANSVSGRRHFRIDKNGSATLQGFFGPNAGSNEAGRDMQTRWLAVTAGDYFEILAFQDTGGTLNVEGPGFAGPSWFQVELMP
jgi:hypothetical protein